MKGKKKCKILKEIRKQIAEQNDIAYAVSECKHQGDCRGTCPKCEAEVRYLEEELKKRSLAGKKVAVAGVAAAMMVSSSGCGLEDLFHVGQTAGDMVIPESQTEVSVPQSSETSKTPLVSETAGELLPEETSEWETMGEEVLPEDSSEEELVDGEIPGDIIMPPEDSDDDSEVELGGAPLPDDTVSEE